MRFTQPVYVNVPDNWTFDAKVTDAGKYQVTSRGIELCIEDLPVGLALYDSGDEDIDFPNDASLMTQEEKAKREKELFEAYQRGKPDGINQAKNAIQSLFHEGK